MTASSNVTLPGRQILKAVWDMDPSTTVEVVAEELGVTVSRLWQHLTAVGYVPPPAIAVAAHNTRAALAKSGHLGHPENLGRGNLGLPGASRCLTQHLAAFKSRPAASMASRQEARPTAVCVTGEMRLFGLSLFNWHWALQLPAVGTRLFYVGPMTSSWKYHEALVRSHALEVKSRPYEAVAVADMGRDANLWTLVNQSMLVINAAHAPALGFATKDGRVQGRFMHVVQMYQQHACGELIRDDEATRHMQYHRVIKIRTDGYFFTRPPEPLEGRVLWPRHHRGDTTSRFVYFQDLFFSAPRELGLALLSSDETLLKPLQRGEKLGNVEYAWGFTAKQWLARAELARSQLNQQQPVLDQRFSFLGLVRGLPGCGGWRPSVEGLNMWPRDEDAAHADAARSARIMEVRKADSPLWEAHEQASQGGELGWRSYVDAMLANG